MPLQDTGSYVFLRNFLPSPRLRFHLMRHRRVLGRTGPADTRQPGESTQKSCSLSPAARSRGRGRQQATPGTEGYTPRGRKAAGQAQEAPPWGQDGQPPASCRTSSPWYTRTITAWERRAPLQKCVFCIFIKLNSQHILLPRLLM